MKISVSTKLNIPADTAWKLVTESNTLLYVTKGLMGFRPISGSLPKNWKEGDSVQMRILLFGLIPAWKHRINFKEVSDLKKHLFTHESGGVISTWNHLIAVEPSSTNECHYTDTVEIKAGPVTLLVWLYANGFYRYRQHRWQKLVKQHASGI